jgi:hypothetical protein
MESYALTQNRVSVLTFAANDAYAIITTKDGKKSKAELYAGSGYLSQSAKYIRITPNIASVEVFDYSGNGRPLYPQAISRK